MSYRYSCCNVATREGGVDRNKQKLYIWIVLFNVATREGGVDRNKDLTETTAAQLAVATREGGVDRNLCEVANSRSCKCRHPRGWRG